MVFYFSGTGNYFHAAKAIAEAQSEQLISIAKEFDRGDDLFAYTLQENELLGFVYPVYAWGPPKMVRDFIGRLKVTGSQPYTFSVCTCGDEEGHTTQVLQKELDKKGIKLNSAFSIQMPNNYILSADVDSKDMEMKKLENAEVKLEEINVVLIKRKSDVFHLNEGKMPGFKTAIVNPLFNRFARSTKKFYATDECTRCGLCEKICPVHTIKVSEKPVWGEACTQCLACINRCPVCAIQYGEATLHRSRYVHPELKSSSK